MKKVATVLLTFTLLTTTLNASCGVVGTVGCAGANIVTGTVKAVGTVVATGAKIVGCTVVTAGKVVAGTVNAVTKPLTSPCHVRGCSR